MASVNNSKRKAFMANVQISFINGSDKIDIESDRIHNIVISHDYETKSMPIIVLSLSVSSEVYSAMVNNTSTAKIYLRVQYKDAYSDTTVSEDYINNQFSYFLSSTSPNYTKTLDESNTNADSNYKNIHIGLMDMDSMNDLRTSFNGVFKNVDQNTLIYMAVENTNIIMQRPTYNHKYDTVIVPPIVSRSRFLRFIFDLDPFYDTDYLYFIDFDTSYLLSRNGEAVHANDGSLDDVIVDVRDVTSEEAYYEGMEIRDNAYYLYVNPVNSNVAINQGSEKVANRLVSFDEDGTEIVELNINRSNDSDPKITFVRTDDPILYKNTIESSSLVLEIVKENIDGRIITPNKCYNVRNYDEYRNYNGKYLLMYKHEVINGKAGEFLVTVSFGLRKLGEVLTVTSISDTERKGMTSSTQRYTTSATKRKVSRKRSTVAST